MTLSKQRSCPICQTVFMKKHKEKYCSKSCKAKAYYNRKGRKTSGKLTMVEWRKKRLGFD